MTDGLEGMHMFDVLVALERDGVTLGALQARVVAPTEADAMALAKLSAGRSESLSWLPGSRWRPLRATRVEP